MTYVWWHWSTSLWRHSWIGFLSYISIIPVVLTHSLDPSEFKVAFVKLTSWKAPLLVNLWHVDVVTKYNNAYLKKKRRWRNDRVGKNQRIFDLPKVFEISWLVSLTSRRIFRKMTIQHIKLMRRPSDFFRVRVDTLKDMVNFSDEKKEKKDWRGNVCENYLWMSMPVEDKIMTHIHLIRTQYKHCDD